MLPTVIAFLALALALGAIIRNPNRDPRRKVPIGPRYDESQAPDSRYFRELRNDWWDRW